MRVPLDARGRLRMRIDLDRARVEVFTADGRQAITGRVFPPDGATRLSAGGVRAPMNAEADEDGPRARSAPA